MKTLMCLLDRWKDSTDLPLETDWDGALVGIWALRPDAVVVDSLSICWPEIS